MRNRICLCLLLFLLGCKAEKKETGILSEQEMVRNLIDITLAEARLNSLPIGRDSANQFFIPFEEKFMKKNNLSDSILMKSYQYYLGHPADLERIYDIVIDSLNLREQKLQTKKK